MSEANAHRGEIEIDLGAAGKFVLRPDFEAVAAIDEQVGGVVALAEKVFRQPASLTLHEAAVIVAECMKGQQRKAGGTVGANVEKVKRYIYEAGIVKVIEPCVALLGHAVTGGAAPDPAEAGND